MLPSTEKRLRNEKLIVYQTTLKFVALTIEIIRQFLKGNADITDQLKRASTSIPFNIAEGAGKNSSADTARYFAIALGSALECGAILDVCCLLKIAENEEVNVAKGHLFEIVSVLSRMCR